VEKRFGGGRGDGRGKKKNKKGYRHHVSCRAVCDAGIRFRSKQVANKRDKIPGGERTAKGKKGEGEKGRGRKGLRTWGKKGIANGKSTIASTGPEKKKKRRGEKKKRIEERGIPTGAVPGGGDREKEEKGEKPEHVSAGGHLGRARVSWKLLLAVSDRPEYSEGKREQPAAEQLSGEDRKERGSPGNDGPKNGKC